MIDVYYFYLHLRKLGHARFRDGVAQTVVDRGRGVDLSTHITLVARILARVSIPAPRASYV